MFDLAVTWNLLTVTAPNRAHLLDAASGKETGDRQPNDKLIINHNIINRTLPDKLMCTMFSKHAGQKSSLFEKKPLMPTLL